MPRNEVVPSFRNLTVALEPIYPLMMVSDESVVMVPEKLKSQATSVSAMSLPSPTKYKRVTADFPSWSTLKIVSDFSKLTYQASSALRV